MPAASGGKMQQFKKMRCSLVPVKVSADLDKLITIKKVPSHLKKQSGVFILLLGWNHKSKTQKETKPKSCGGGGQTRKTWKCRASKGGGGEVEDGGKGARTCSTRKGG